MTTDTASGARVVHARLVLSYDELIARNRSLEMEREEERAERRKLEALLRAEQDRANTEREMRVRLEEEKAFALRQLEELRKSYAILQQEHELQRRRIFEAKAERVDPSQLELEFEKTRAALDEMQKKLVEAADGPPPAACHVRASLAPRSSCTGYPRALETASPPSSTARSGSWATTSTSM